MARPEKVQAVTDIKEQIEGSDAVFVAEYAGLSVKQQQALRRGLKDSDAEFKVVKMTLARRAADELELSELDEFLTGPTGLTFANDAVGAAKVLDAFARDNAGLVIKGGLLGRDILSAERVGQLAKIEPLEVLLAKIAGAMKAPMAKVAGVLAALPRNAASVFSQLLDKKEAAGPAEVAEPAAAADEPADEPETAAAPDADASDAAPAQAEADDVVADEATGDDETPDAVEAAADAVADEPDTDDSTDEQDDDTAAAAEEE